MLAIDLPDSRIARQIDIAAREFATFVGGRLTPTRKTCRELWRSRSGILRATFFADGDQVCDFSRHLEVPLRALTANACSVLRTLIPSTGLSLFLVATHGNRREALRTGAAVEREESEDFHGALIPRVATTWMFVLPHQGQNIRVDSQRVVKQRWHRIVARRTRLALERESAS